VFIAEVVVFDSEFLHWIFMLPLQVQQGVVKVVWSHGNFRYVSFNMVRCRHRYGADHIHI